MLENLKRIREPLAWGLIAATVLAGVLAVVQLVLFMDWTQEDSYLLWLAGVRLVPYDLALALLAAAWACAVPPEVRRSRSIAVTAAVVVTVGTLATAVQTVMSLLDMREWIELSSVLSGSALDLLVGLLASIGLWALAAPARAAASPQAAQPDHLPDLVPEAVEPPAEGPAPVWGRTEAVGTAWRTADDAAAGAPGSATFPTEAPDEAQAWRRPSEEQ